MSCLVLNPPRGVVVKLRVASVPGEGSQVVLPRGEAAHKLDGGALLHEHFLGTLYLRLLHCLGRKEGVEVRSEGEEPGTEILPLGC